MEALSKINLPELAPQSSVSVTLTKPSRISPKDAMGCTLLMMQAKDRYIHVCR
jgi:hypothetical protein